MEHLKTYLYQIKHFTKVSVIILSILFINGCKKDKPTLPIVITNNVTEISYTTATSGGEATNEGGAPVLSKGICWGTSANPTVSANQTTASGGLGSFTGQLTLLTANTLYYVRAFATNSAGTGYGNEISFKTLTSTLPVLTTTPISSLTTNSFISGGTITDDGGASITVRGICWNTASNPTTGDNKTIEGAGAGNFTSSISGLLPNMAYYIRAYATNNAGTAYGNDQVILTYAVADIEGNFYHAVSIGTQTWLQENLNVTKFNNGDPIGTTIPADKDISLETDPAYQWSFEGNEAKVITYGRLYTWYVVTDNRKICPSGWHVSTDSEWTTMETWLNANGYNYDGTTTFDLYNKLAKALASATLWSASGTPGAPGNIDFPEYRNKSGFTALPGSQRGNYGGFGMLEVDGSWWTSTEIQNNIAFAWARQINRSAPNENRVGSTKDTGMSVRCVRD